MKELINTTCCGNLKKWITKHCLVLNTVINVYHDLIWVILLYLISFTSVYQLFMGGGTMEHRHYYSCYCITFNSRLILHVQFSLVSLPVLFSYTSRGLTHAPNNNTCQFSINTRCSVPVTSCTAVNTCVS